MYALDALKVMVRRWYVVLAGLLLVGVAGVAALVLVPTAYQASGQLVLLLPVTATGDKTPTNPYLNAPAGLTTTASLLAGNAVTDEVQRSLAGSGYGAEYSVSVVPGAGPLIVVTASGSDPTDVVATRDRVMSRIDAELQVIQRDVFVPASQFMFTRQSATSPEAEVLPGSRLRALIGVTGAGGIVVLASTFGLDRLLEARRRRRATETPRAAVATRAPDPVPDPIPDPAPDPVPDPVRAAAPTPAPALAAVGPQGGRDGAACVGRP